MAAGLERTCEQAAEVTRFQATHRPPESQADLESGNVRSLPIHPRRPHRWIKTSPVSPSSTDPMRDCKNTGALHHSSLHTNTNCMRTVYRDSPNRAARWPAYRVRPTAARVRDETPRWVRVCKWVWTITDCSRAWRNTVRTLASRAYNIKQNFSAAYLSMEHDVH